MSHAKLIGGVLLIVGTSIGGGMLALPVSTASTGLVQSIVLMLGCWLVMTLGALLILEVNLRLPPGSNMISMAKKTLGFPGQAVAWVAYLMQLYSLLGAYISGGSDVLSGLLTQLHITLPNWISSIAFTVLFAGIVYQGIRTVDYVNRGLMFGKLGVYCLLLFIISPHVNLMHFTQHTHGFSTASLMILVTSFGFATIIPSMREYFSDNVRSLRQVIWIGSLIPLLCYIVWIIVIRGVIPLEGSDGLLGLANSEHPTSGLTSALSFAVSSQWITGFFEFFTSICMITAFLGVSLGLFDFLADGFNLKRQGPQKTATLMLTFLPPLLLVIVSPGIYLQALSYAGVCCVILLLLLPSLMAWRARRLNKVGYVVMVAGGNVALLIITLISILLLFFAFK